MGFVTTMIGMPVVWPASRLDHWRHRLATGTALLSFSFGPMSAWHIGISDHLFTPGPIGIPQ